MHSLNISIAGSWIYIYYYANTTEQELFVNVLYSHNKFYERVVQEYNSFLYCIYLFWTIYCVVHLWYNKKLKYFSIFCL